MFEKGIQRPPDGAEDGGVVIEDDYPFMHSRIPPLGREECTIKAPDRTASVSLAKTRKLKRLKALELSGVGEPALEAYEGRRGCHSTKATNLAFMICHPRSAHLGLLAETGQSRLQTAMTGHARDGAPIAALNGALNRADPLRQNVPRPPGSKSALPWMKSVGVAYLICLPVGDALSARLEQSSPRRTQVAPSTLIAAASDQKACEAQYQQCLKKIVGYTRNRIACEKAFRECQRRKE